MREYVFCSLDCGIIVCHLIFDYSYGFPISETMTTTAVQSFRRDILQEIMNDHPRSWTPQWAKQTTTPNESDAITVKPLSIAYPKKKAAKRK